MIAGSLAPPAAPAAQTMFATPQSRRAVPTAGTVALALRIAVLAFAGVLLVAAIVHFALAGRYTSGWATGSQGSPPTRTWRWRSSRTTHGRSSACSGCCWSPSSQHAAHRGPRAQRLILAAGELILTGVIAANVLVLGAGLGAYGERMARAELPHGPVELAAYALALALYRQGRKRILPAGHLAKVAAVSVALLALAATLETFVNV
jgi:hypothetical protein